MTPHKMVYLVRHGHVGPDHCRRYLGKIDWPLSTQGMAQAERLGERLATVPFGRIITSGLTRTRQTAACIVRGRDLTIESLTALNEIDMGQWDTLTPQEARSRFPEESRLREQDLFTFRPPGGESFAELAGRVLPAFEVIARHPSESTLIVGHAAVNRLILCHVLGMPLPHLFRLGQDYGALNCIEGNNGNWRVSLLNCPLGPA